MKIIPSQLKLKLELSLAISWFDVFLILSFFLGLKELNLRFEICISSLKILDSFFYISFLSCSIFAVISISCLFLSSSSFLKLKLIILWLSRLILEGDLGLFVVFMVTENNGLLRWKVGLLIWISSSWVGESLAATEIPGLNGLQSGDFCT